MKSVKIQLRLPEEMKVAVKRQAEAAGVSVNLFVATAVAARVGAQAEVGRYMVARGARTTVARAKALLERMGTGGDVREGDRLEEDEVGI